MTIDVTSALEDCLERLAQGENIQACLARYPEQAAELKPLLVAASRVERGTQLKPSAAFRARARNRLGTYMAAHPRSVQQPVLRIPRPAKRLSPLSRLSFGMSALLLAFTVTGTALAQSALPGTALYSWKLASEQVWRAFSTDPAGVDLALADRRIDEFLAVTGNAADQNIALDGYRQLLLSLAQFKDPSDQVRIETNLKQQQERVKNSGQPVVLPVVAPGSGGNAPQPLTVPKTKNPAPTAVPGLKIPSVLATP